MDLLAQYIDLLLHIDRYLPGLIHQYGHWIYALLFLIVFCETGLVVTPLLPGDSLLFVAGTLAAAGSLDVNMLCILLVIAAIAGDTVNYWIGAWVGPRVFHESNARFFKKEYLDRTHRFYERFGGKTIIIARFVPIVRTFAPFVAGIGRMSYTRFLVYNVTGGFLWVYSLTWCGYLFGNLPVVRENYSTVVLAIIIISITPMIYEYLRHKRTAA
jgi:membrane-associated protein